MRSIPTIAIIDIGRTNKKLLLFDEGYKLIYEESQQLPEIKDEDGFPCEDVHVLTNFIKESFSRLLENKRYNIKGINFTAYGASFVYLDKNLRVSLPLYNYLKPFSASLTEKFYSAYGGESSFAKTTASPVLGNLNSGMQLYRIKYERPHDFAAIKYALHLPQYIGFILTGKLYSDITSIGCHTNLWDFQNNQYHYWVNEEGMADKLPPIMKSDKVAGLINKTIPAGAGLHDSSAALIPYLISFSEPFILLSTGTWCITLNPFNHLPLTDDELQKDCLCYLSYKENPIKASRLFAGHEHEEQVKRLSQHFSKPPDYYKSVPYDINMLHSFLSHKNILKQHTNDTMLQQSHFSSRDLQEFKSYEEAYHQLMEDIIVQQVKSTHLVLQGTGCKRIFVDGGFGNNPIYMNLLAKAFPDIEVYAASVPQASALGAALVIHPHWNSKRLPDNIIELKYYSTKREILTSGD